MNDVNSTADNEVLTRICSAITALRAAVLAWGAVVVYIDANSGVLTNPTPAVALLGALAAYTLWWGRQAQNNPSRLARTATWTDTTLAALVYIVDQYAYAGPHPQTFASAWPLTAVIAVGVLRGHRTGAAAGAVAGTANMAAAGVWVGLDGNILALSGTLVLLTAAGWIAGQVAGRLRSDAATIARAEAREELARDLHDGVLQTLAVVQRRSDDRELVELARRQEHDLRGLITAETDLEHCSVADELRKRQPDWAAHGVHVDVIVIDPGTCTPRSSSALTAAAHEAVINAAKHAGVDHVTVSVDRGEHGGTIVVVHDEGVGYDPDTTQPGIGTTRSITGRLNDIGGTATTTTQPGKGCDVTLWAP